MAAIAHIQVAEGYEPDAALLAETLGVSVVAFPHDPAVAASQYPLALHFDDQGLSLVLLNSSTGAVRCDFVSGASRHRRLYGGGLGQDIAKAAGLHKWPSNVAPLSILDLTAGLGRDGFVLASLGARVMMVEQHPVVFALLEDGFRRATESVADGRNVGGVKTEGDDPLKAILSRVSIECATAESVMASYGENAAKPVANVPCPPDVIYLDPMFPPREKSSKVKKEMQLLHQLVGVSQSEGEIELLEQALQLARYRVVVKRPSYAPFLGNKKPGYSLGGKSTRFDIYPLKKMVT